MPYIAQHDRARAKKYPTTPGELNYALTCHILTYLENKYDGDQVTYADMNEVIGVLESVKLEFYRRMVVPYESTKIAQNGDVYP